MDQLTPRLAGPFATFTAAAVFASLVSLALRLAWDPPIRTYLEYAPIGTVCALLVWDRLFPIWRESRRGALCDALVIVLGSMRVFVPPLPFVSGHALVAAYAALSARRWPLRCIALVVLAEVVYEKAFASPGWRSMLSGLLLACLIAAVRTQFADTGLKSASSGRVSRNISAASMLTVPYERFTVRSSLVPEEFADRLRRISRRRYWGVWSQADARFVGAISASHFKLAYVPHGRNTHAPWLIGGIHARPDGSEIDVRMTIHPAAVAAMIPFLCVPQYFAIRAGGFSLGFLAGFLVFHIFMYCFAFVPDALDAESLIREVAIMSEQERRTSAEWSTGRDMTSRQDDDNDRKVEIR